MKRQFMLDLETLSVEPDAVILSIGIVEFDETSILRELYLKLDLKQQPDRHISADTLKWWTTQDPTTMREAFSGTTDPYTVLDKLRQFIGDRDDAAVWGNGAVMDNTILTHFAMEFDEEPLWSYKGDRCLRTVRAMPAFKVWRRDNEVTFLGAEHNALHDARHQATELIEFNKWAAKMGFGVFS